MIDAQIGRVFPLTWPGGIPFLSIRFVCDRCSDRKGIPPALGQGEYLSYLYGLFAIDAQIGRVFPVTWPGGIPFLSIQFVCDGCSAHQTIQFAIYIYFFIINHIFLHLKLLFAEAILALNL